MDNKTIVLTLYGTKEAISDFSITLFIVLVHLLNMIIKGENHGRLYL
jgi:hypothetical protein